MRLRSRHFIELKLHAGRLALAGAYDNVPRHPGIAGVAGFEKRGAASNNCPDRTARPAASAAITPPGRGGAHDCEHRSMRRRRCAAWSAPPARRRRRCEQAASRRRPAAPCRAGPIPEKSPAGDRYDATTALLSKTPRSCAGPTVTCASKMSSSRGGAALHVCHFQLRVSSSANDPIFAEICNAHGCPRRCGLRARQTA